MVKGNFGIVNSIQAHLYTHILNHYTLARLHVISTDAHNKATNSLILASDNSLGKHNGVVRVAGTISDPEFLGEHAGGVNVESLSFRFVGGGGLHFGSIIAVAKFSETEATHVFKAVNFIQNGEVTFSVKRREGSTEEVELHGKFSGEIAVDKAQKLMSSENVLGVILKIKDRYEILIAYALDAGIGLVTLSVK
jgi:hypothetical protein